MTKFVRHPCVSMGLRNRRPLKENGFRFVPSSEALQGMTDQPVGGALVFGKGEIFSAGHDDFFPLLLLVELVENHVQSERVTWLSGSQLLELFPSFV